MATGCRPLYTPPFATLFGQVAVVCAPKLGSATVRGAGVLWQPQWLADAPLRLLHTLAGLLPWGLMAWRPLVFFQRPRDRAEFIFFDGACDGRTWRMALWGYTM